MEVLCIVSKDRCDRLYDDESWLAKEMHVPFVTQLTIVNVSRCVFEYANRVGVSVFDASEVGLFSSRMQTFL